MRLWPSLTALCLACAVFAAHAVPVPKDPAALDIADVFSHACLHNGSQPARVAAWARAQKLPELVATDARKALYADGADGRAWFIPGPATSMYLAIRGRSGTCALFGEHADAGDFGLIYDEYLQFLTPAGSRVERSPDHVTQGAFGTATERAATIHAGRGKTIHFAMSANQKPGGPYQVSLVMATK
jgi:hypothetical protein